MSWASKRKTIYTTGVILFFVALISPFIYSALTKPPTCFDDKQNQGETAIDIGGPCKLRDYRYLQPMSVLWSRSFPVRHGQYSSVAYIENPNPRAGIQSINYQFKLYDDRNILIESRIGRIPVLPGKVMPVFESNISTGNRTISRTFFEFISPERWVRMSNPTEGIEIRNEKLSETSSTPRIDATAFNSTVKLKKNIVFIATVFDEASNAIAVSRTFVERFEPNTEKNIAFTWPNAFAQKPARIDIIPLMLPTKE